MKIDALINKMKQLGVALPSTGTGKNGRILARDLETALGDHYFKHKYARVSNEHLHHALMRRLFTPMKSYRYDKLKPHEQAALFTDNNQWLAEEKFNGWRMVITFVPDDGFRFWGGNISDVDFLPADYTEHIANMNYPSFARPEPYAIDAEVVCYDQVEALDGLSSVGTLDAVGIILGSSPERARELQADATLIFKCFDCIPYAFATPEGLLMPLESRRLELQNNLSVIKDTRFELVSQKSINKKQYLNSIWKKGGEGCILKNKHTNYVSGGRLRTHSIKVKRTMSGEIGDTIDAFVSGWIETPEWRKQSLIGGLELSVYSGEGQAHHIATVTGMPDDTRRQLTHIEVSGNHTLRPAFIGQVVVLDGQELSSKHKKLMHAKIDWSIGFRQDKKASDCILDIEELKEEKF